MQAPPDSLRADSLPVLTHYGTGAHAHVFGRTGWVVRIPRTSPLSLVSSVVRNRRWLRRVRLELGGLTVPSFEIDSVAFRAPQVATSWISGSAVPNTERIYRAPRATVAPFIPPHEFLDQRFYASSSEEGQHLLETMLDLLVNLLHHRFVMLDFIMANFVFYDGELKIADSDLIVPAHLIRWNPSYVITHSQFQRYLLADYDKLLANKNAPISFRRHFASRIRRLTSPVNVPPPAPRPSRFPDAIALDASTSLSPHI